MYKTRNTSRAATANITAQSVGKATAAAADNCDNTVPQITEQTDTSRQVRLHTQAKINYNKDFCILALVMAFSVSQLSVQWQDGWIVG